MVAIPWYVTDYISSIFLLQQSHSLLADYPVVLDRLVIIVVARLDRRLIARVAHGSVDKRVRFLYRLDRFASGLVVDGEETRLPAVIGLEPVRVVVQTRAKRDADEIGIGCETPREKVV